MNAPLAQALILAAGRGERMRPLTDQTPKPLLKVRGRPLIEWHLQALAAAQVQTVVINTAWLGEQFPQTLGTGERWGLNIRYSHEGQDFGHALETAGGIARALPMLDEVFWVLAGDVYCPDFAFNPATLAHFKDGLGAHRDKWAHLWLVPNPDFKKQGDFDLDPQGLAVSPIAADSSGHTYSTIGLYRREFFMPPSNTNEALTAPAGQCPWISPPPWGNPQGLQAPLAPMLRQAMQTGHVSAEIYWDQWTDVGTPQRLREINRL